MKIRIFSDFLHEVPSTYQKQLELEKTMLSRQILATDAAIDKLVYELYELTEEEIKIMERRGKKVNYFRKYSESILFS